jgi:hypothetical protein
LLEDRVRAFNRSSAADSLYALDLEGQHGTVVELAEYESATVGHREHSADRRCELPGAEPHV